MRATDPAVLFLLVLAIGIVTSVLVGVAGSFVGYHIAMLALGGGLMISLIGAAAGAAVVLFVWRMVK